MTDILIGHIVNMTSLKTGVKFVLKVARRLEILVLHQQTQIQQIQVHKQRQQQLQILTLQIPVQIQQLILAVCNVTIIQIQAAN